MEPRMWKKNVPYDSEEYRDWNRERMRRYRETHFEDRVYMLGECWTIGYYERGVYERHIESPRKGDGSWILPILGVGATSGWVSVGRFTV